jgi:spore coat assembly protein
MATIKPGDIVVRKSYGGDIYFKVLKVNNGICTLKGMDVRLLADSPVDDLEVKGAEEILMHRHETIQQNLFYLRRIRSFRSLSRTKYEDLRGTNRAGKEAVDDFFDVPGRVLHLDGDEEYLNKCLDNYRQLNVPVEGFYIPESEQPKVVQKLIREYRPDILVLTGHDAVVKGIKDFSDLNNYRHSKYFVEAVKKARELNNDLDDLVIFAGACQSHYEDILRAGANFASAPQRVLIHTFDPVFIAEKIAYTPINETISIKDIIQQTITGDDGVGGVQTRGKYRLGYPKSPY